MSFVLSTRLLDPQFQGQVKEKLNSREAVKLVSTMIRDPFEVWLNGHVEYGKAIAEMAAKAAATRLKSAQKTEKRKTSGVAVLPGKLSDAATDDPVIREIFLVEGDSRRRQREQARDRETQAILPLRGKVMNSWETDPNALYANKEIHDIAVALGVERHKLGDHPHHPRTALPQGRDHDRCGRRRRTHFHPAADPPPVTFRNWSNRGTSMWRNRR